jgi:IS30 family transposase
VHENLQYHHLSLEEREFLFLGRAAGVSLRKMAKRLGRSHASLVRECKRNAKYEQPYVPCRAHAQATRRSARQRYQAPLKSPLVFLYVREHLRLGWSPEQIAGRLPIDFPGQAIDDETIYRYIYKDEAKKEALWQYLARRRRKRMKKLGRGVQRQGKIPEAVSIDLRPDQISKRTEAGHWETDNMEGKRSDTGAVSVLVERSTRFTLLGKLTNRGSTEKARSVVGELKVFPHLLRQTLTADNGAENKDHRLLTAHLGTAVYFCHAYHSWEKGTVENTVGRIRRYVPKHRSVDPLTDIDLRVVQEKLNSTPRKCLGFRTPYETMTEAFQALP